MYTPQTGIKDWKQAIADAAHAFLPDAPITAPVRCDLSFLMPRPKCHFNSRGALKPTAPTHHVCKPDRDNLDKPILDVLTDIGMIKDDCQVYDGRITKEYGPYESATVGTIGVLVALTY